jgi:hypothetical protein
MRSPKRKKPLQRKITATLPQDAEKRIAATRYVGSPEHKRTPSFAGTPRLRRDASLCDDKLARQQGSLTQWLHQALSRGCCSSFPEHGYPKYVWYRIGDTMYEGRLVNSVSGEYKGYALTEDEWPKDIRDCHG